MTMPVPSGGPWARRFPWLSRRALGPVHLFAVVVTLHLAGPGGVRAQESIPQVPPIEPVGVVRRDLDGDGAPDRVGERVAVRGVALVSTGDFHHQQLDVPLADATGGIFLFAMTFDQDISAGDTLVVWGLVGEYRGKAQLQVEGYRVLGGGPVSAPQRLEAMPEDWEPLEGHLITLDARVVTKGRNQGGPYVVVLPDAAPDRPITVFSRGPATSATAVEALQPEDRIVVTGVVGQYDTSPPYLDGYQIYPRGPDDVVAVGFSRRDYVQAGVVVLILLVAALGWSLGLRREVSRQTRALRISEEQIRTLMERSPGAILVLCDDEVAYANRAASAFFSIDEGSRPRLGDFLPEADAEALKAASAEAGDKPWQGVLRVSGGEDREVEVLSVDVTFEGRPARQVWVHDISARNREVRERERVAEQLQERHRFASIIALAGGFAHDYNNLMVGIMGNTGLLAESERLGPEEWALVDGIQGAAESATELTQRILTLAGRSGLRREDLDLAAFVEGVLEGLAGEGWPSVPAHTLEEVGVVQGDPGQLREMIVALLANAREALGGEVDGINVTLRLEDSPREIPVHGGALSAGEYAQVTIEDTGPGMSAETLRRSFDPMFTTKELGRGLGLASARGILEAHGGGISVETQPGRGTRVSVYLPFRVGRSTT